MNPPIRVAMSGFGSVARQHARAVHRIHSTRIVAFDPRPVSRRIALRQGFIDDRTPDALTVTSLDHVPLAQLAATSARGPRGKASGRGRSRRRQIGHGRRRIRAASSSCRRDAAEARPRRRDRATDVVPGDARRLREDPRCSLPIRRFRIESSLSRRAGETIEQFHDVSEPPSKPLARQASHLLELDVDHAATPRVGTEDDLSALTTAEALIQSTLDRARTRVADLQPDCDTQRTGAG